MSSKPWTFSGVAEITSKTKLPVEVTTGPWTWPVGALKMSSSSGCWKEPGTTSVRRPPLSFEVGSVEYCAATFFQFASESSARSAW